MARRKKQIEETISQSQERQNKEQVANHATRCEKTSWMRKQKNLLAIVKKANALQEQILDLTTKQMGLFDQVSIARKDMVDTCIHLYDGLVYSEDGIVTCNFCKKVMKVCNII